MPLAPEAYVRPRVIQRSSLLHSRETGATPGPGGGPPAGYVAGRGRGMGMGGPGGEEHAGPPEEVEREDYSESNYDEFSGYGHTLFGASDPYEKDDEEADRVSYQSSLFLFATEITMYLEAPFHHQLWANVDDRMDERRQKRREERIKGDLEKYRAERPKIQAQFSDLKKELATVTDAEWNSIPDPGDRLSKKRARPERYTPVPDSLVLSSMNAEMNTLKSIDPRMAGFQTPSTPLPGTMTDLNQIGAARKTVLNLKLHQVSDSVSGQTVVQPKEYLTDLNSIAVTTDAEIGYVVPKIILLFSLGSLSFFTYQ